MSMDKSIIFIGHSIEDKMPNPNQNVLIKAKNIEEIVPAVYEKFIDEDGEVHHLFKDPYYGQTQIYVIEEVVEWFENPNF